MRGVLTTLGPRCWMTGSLQRLGSAEHLRKALSLADVERSGLP